jgi:PAS domain S-box-containing protein
MVQTYPVAAGIQLLTAIGAAGLWIALLLSEKQNAGSGFGLLVTGVIGWSLASGLSALLSDPVLTYAFGVSIYPFMLIGAIGWVYLTDNFTGKKITASRGVTASFGVVLLAEILVIASNQSHNLFYSGPAAAPASGVVEPVFGPLYWVHVAVTVGLFCWGFAYLGAEFQTAKGIYGEQMKAIAAGGLFPLTFSLAEMIGLIRITGIDLGVIGLSIAIIVLFYGMFYTDLLDLVPFQRDTLIENMDHAVIALDADGRILDLNAETTATFGVPTSAVGTLFAEAFESLPKLVDEVSTVTDGTKEISIESDDGQRDYSITVSSMARDDGPTGVFGVAEQRSTGRVVVIRDITAQRKRERRLKQYRSVVETAGDPIFVLDEHGTIELVNEAMVDFLGRDHGDLIGTHVGEFLQPENLSKMTETITHMALTGDKQEFMMERTESDGTTRTYEVHTQLIGNETPDDDAAGSVGVIRDVTEHESRKQELDLLGQVLTRVLRHNIRNDVIVIRGHAEVIAEKLEGQVASNAEVIISKSDDLTALAENAREAKEVLKQRNQREVLELTTAVDEALDESLYKYPHATLKRDLKQGWIRSHPSIWRGFRNLIENAILHNESDEPVVELASNVSNDWVELTIKDNGPGIHEDELEVFERDSETALSHGSGLGLWVVTWLVDRSGAEITFDSSDRGTEVTIRFERAPHPQSQPDQPEEVSGRPQGRTQTVEDR